MRRTGLEPYLGARPVPNGLQVSVEVWEPWEGDLRGEQAGTSAPTWKNVMEVVGVRTMNGTMGGPAS